MKQTVVAIRDRVAEAFSRPVFVASAGLAVRSFMDEVRNPEAGDVHKHPGDFDLYQLGVFDDSTGLFECDPVPMLLIKGSAATTSQEV